MKKPTLRWVGIQFGIWLYVGCAAIGLIYMLNNDRASAMIAGVVFAGVVLFSRYVLGLEYLSVPMLYLGMLGLFHLGLVVPWAFGLYDPRDVWWFRREELGPPLILLSLAFLGFQLGLILGGGQQNVLRGKGKGTRTVFVQDGTLFWAGLCLFAVGLLSYAIGLYVIFGFDFFSYTYAETFSVLREEDTRLIYLGVLIVPIGAYATVAGASPMQLKAALLLITIWGGWQLFAGVRSRALLIFVIAVYILKKKGVRLPRVSFPAMVALALVIVPAVQVMRGEVASRRLQAQVFALQDLNPLNGITEMGHSIWPVVGTYRLAEVDGLRHGRTYLHTLAKIIPGLPSPLDPRGTLAYSRYDLQPSRWFVSATEPGLLKLGLGPAFSAVAEAYLNFGIPGVCLIFFGLGFSLAYLEGMPLTSAHLVALQGVILGPLLWGVRNDSYAVGRPLLWGLAYILVVRLVSVRSRRGAQNEVDSRSKSRGAEVAIGQAGP